MPINTPSAFDLRFETTRGVSCACSPLSTVHQAFGEAFNKTHDEFTTHFAHGSEAGTTALCVLLRRNVLWVANAGDSMAVRCTSGNAEVMTRMHRPSEPAERALVEAKGGMVLHYNDAWRVNGVLSVSRSLGDSSNSEYLSHAPEVFSHEIDFDHDEFFVIATDGLWDWMSPQVVLCSLCRAVVCHVLCCAMWCIVVFAALSVECRARHVVPGLPVVCCLGSGQSLSGHKTPPGARVQGAKTTFVDLKSVSNLWHFSGSGVGQLEFARTIIDPPPPRNVWSLRTT